VSERANADSADVVHVESLQRNLAALYANNAALHANNAALTAELEDTRASLERVRDAYRRALEELALHKRRMFVQTSERRSDPEGQLAFDSLLATFRALSAQLQQAEEDAAGGQDTTNDPAGTTHA